MHVPHVGLVPSQRNFLLRHSTQAIRFGLLAASASLCVPVLLVAEACDCAALGESPMKLSFGDSDDLDDIFG